MTESVLLIILLIALAEVINSIKNNRPTASNIGRLFYIRFKTLGLTAFNGFPCVLIIYYAKSNVNIPFEFYIAENVER
ncbi:MAG TPA: hypothetical protein PLS64_07030 [Ruminococcus bromii]|nr:hypothetical protein [Ruminococcus bromii]HRL43610.1 hypothetical protein [Ruminococcus bromii]